jgi:hypothetical protein
VFPKIISEPVSTKDSGNIALTVAEVPTGMKAGVLICPCAVEITPLLALPHMFFISKEIDISSIFQYLRIFFFYLF